MEDEIVLKEAFRHAKEVLEPEELINWFRTAAEPFYRSATWEALLPLYEDLLDTAKRELDPEDPVTAVVLNGLAGIYRYMGKHDEALKLFSRALSIREKASGPEHPETGDTLSELGILYYVMDRQEEALLHYKRALEIQEKFLSPENPGAIRTLNRMAFFYKGVERPEKAEELFTRALGLLEKLDEKEPENKKVLAYTAGTLNNLGVLLSEMGKLEEAEERYGQALKLQE
ncbi:MAG: tetratricopeptide repeat protein, partial [Methanosarcina sp.]|nr:tetratricopeptide repeat protein [Methanosarcina sp.]